MELVRWEPFDGMSRLHSRINDLFDESVGRARTLPSATAGAWLPPVDTLESNELYWIRPIDATTFRQCVAQLGSNEKSQ